jgi:N-acetylglucosamine kinase-like BadF-type ATPase
MEMKSLVKRIPATALVVCLFAITALAQPRGQETAANLRVQLTEVEVRQAEMQARDAQLQEALQPENIERTVAGIGSTHPERLREERQRQLEIVGVSVRLQLDQLDRSRARLEAAIAEADALAYWQSAGICNPPEDK